MNTFYTATATGVSKKEILEEFDYMGRKFIIWREYFTEEYVVSDFITGMLVCKEDLKAAAKKEAKEKIKKANENNFDFEKFPSINDPEAIKLWELVSSLYNDYKKYKPDFFDSFDDHEFLIEFNNLK